MKAEWAKRSSFSKCRNGSTPMVPWPMCSWRSSLEPRAALASFMLPDSDGLEAHRGRDLAHGFFVAFRSDEVVSSHVRVAGIKTDADRRPWLDASHYFGHLVKASAQGELGAGGVFNEDMKTGSLPRETIDGASDRLPGQPEAFIAREALPRAGMKHKVLGAEGEGLARSPHERRPRSCRESPGPGNKR